MDTDDGSNRPEYRDRDRKEYLFVKYAHETHETFSRIDREGFALKEEDGTYKMDDLGRRVCYGKQQPKNRRSGNTNKGLSNGIEVITRTIGTDGMGIQSYSNDNSEEHFLVKLMPAFFNLPIWIQPRTTSGRTSAVLKLDVGKNDFGQDSLNTKVTYATTASEKFYDGKKLRYMLTDEAGKTENTSVLKRHDVNKNTVAQGNGRVISGWMDYPSTVDEMTDGSFDYRFLSNTSSFYQRIKSSGQTFSGLFRLFIPAVEGLDGFVDSYGYSVDYEIKDYQREEGFTQTAYDFLQGKRDALLAKGDPESMRAYREEKKLFPIKYEDCWLGEAGDLGFDLEKIDERLSELRRKDPMIRGNLEWVDGEFGGEVEFVVDDENGRFELAERPELSVSNKKIKDWYYSSIEGKEIPMWKPQHAGRYVVGVDPFRFGNKQDAKIGVTKGKKSRLSDGGISVLMMYDESIDGSKPKDEWHTYRFVMSYRQRHGNIDDFSEDVLKAAIYFGAMVYLETNVTTTYEYFVRKEFGAYLLHDVDKFTGKYKEKAGVDSLERSKQDLFLLLKDYIYYRSHIEPFASFLRECKDIRGMEEMRSYDRLTAHGIALMGAKSATWEDMKKQKGEKGYDLNNYIDFYDIVS
jgi:hypothetical protein